MAAPSMVSRSGDNLIVRSVVSGDALYGTEEKEEEEFSFFDQSNSGDEEVEEGTTELPQCKIKRNYTCSTCDYFTQNPRFFLYHLKEVHHEKIKIYECEHCLYASKHSQKLQRHIHMVHIMGAGKRKLVRNKIKKPVQKPHPIYQAEEHVEEEPIYAADGTQIFKCSVCDMTSKSQTLVSRHERVVHLKKKFYRCGKCNYVTHMKARYTKHVKYHSMPMIKCDLCDFKTPYKWNLDRHTKNHMGDGPFKCSVCNFAADIKQSLTVHEMNHHVPPVGHIAPPNRRRLKVGASDTMGMVTEEDQIDQSELELLKMERECAFEQNPADFVQTQLDFPSEFYNPPDGSGSSSPFKDHFLSQVQLNPTPKYDCRLCDFEGSLEEVQSHELDAHQPKIEKKKNRPIPNLIPIQGPKVLERKIQINDDNISSFCANSSLKDFAPLLGGEEFREESSDKKLPESFKKKNASFFDKLKEKLLKGANESNLQCLYCSHESKCLSEHMKHQKIHIDEEFTETSSLQFQSSELSSIRCQHCRHRCKSSSHLMVHLQSCSELNQVKTEDEEEEEESEIKHSDDEKESDVPMEKKVFVWNSINEDRLERQEEPSYDISESFRIQEKAFVGVELKPGYGTATNGDAEESVNFRGNISTKKVFKCPHCTFWASTASRFHVHIVGHLNKRPFQCSLCHYSSNWRWDITKHIRLKTLRDPVHEKAKVLLTDETGRRNYSKYNKFLTTIQLEAAHNKPNRKILPKEPVEMFPKSYNLKRKEPPLEDESPPKKAQITNKKTLWKCKKCHFRHCDRSVVLAHVKEHYKAATESSAAQLKVFDSLSQSDSSTKASPSQTDNDESSDNQKQNFICETCPFLCETWAELESHAEKHFVSQGSTFKCHNCKYFAKDQDELNAHVDLHEAVKINQNEEKELKPFTCLQCPYEGTSSEQLSYHVRCHGKEENQHKCHKCSYCAPNNLILALHVRLHGRRNNEVEQEIKIEDVKNADISGVDTSKYRDIPMVWVSKPMGISKLFKCRYCPHLNMRKTNIQDHEKMHSSRIAANASATGQILFSCPDCSYVSTNAGILSTHIKVHQGCNGQVLGIVDPSRTDNEQIEEMKQKINQDDKIPFLSKEVSMEIKDSSKGELSFCPVCPARFTDIKLMEIHMKFHGNRKYSLQCSACTYKGREQLHIDSHKNVHSDSYQQETHEMLITMHVSDLWPRPKVAIVLGEKDLLETTWVVVKSDEETQSSKSLACDKCPAKFHKNVALTYHLTLHGGPGPHKCRSCDYAVKTYGNLIKHEAVHQGSKNFKGKRDIPSSGTELFRQKIEANATASISPNPVKDSEFGTQMHGSPEFVYPTYKKNGKLKEKKYKCHKCPSAFEKREQYKIHLSLHGSKQRYKCERCDYSVKYYANYCQHIKKHEQNDNYKRFSSEEGGEELEMSEGEAPVFERSGKTMNMSQADHQAIMIMHQRNMARPLEKESVSRCQECPYANNNRKDGVAGHMRCHYKPSTYTCKYCSYSVPQAHFLREHVKVHFNQLKFIKPEAYMKIDKLEIWAEPLDKNHNQDKILIFKDNGEQFDNKDRFTPYKDVNLDNNDKVFINLQTCEEVKDNEKGFKNDDCEIDTNMDHEDNSNIDTYEEKSYPHSIASENSSHSDFFSKSSEN